MGPFVAQWYNYLTETLDKGEKFFDGDLEKVFDDELLEGEEVERPCKFFMGIW